MADNVDLLESACMANPEDVVAGEVIGAKDVGDCALTIGEAVGYVVWLAMPMPL
jgi:hypothetical protein